MKILMVLDHEFPPDVRVENEIEALTEADHQVHIACYSMKNNALTDQFGKGVIHRKRISKFTHKTSVGCLRFPFYFNFWRSFLFDLHEQYHFDAVHIHDLPLAQIGFEMKAKYDIRFILDLHENWPALLEQADHTKSILGRFLSNQNQWKSYERKLSAKADNIIVVVDEAKQRLIDLGIVAEKITVVSNTLNSNHFKVPDSKPDKNYFTMFYAGGINRHRGIQTIIPALKILPSHVRLLLLGTGSYVAELKQLATEYGVSEKVEFHGWQPFDKMNQLMGEADVCLIPHVKSAHTDNTIPHKLFQYMYAKKPVIASDCAPIQRIIEANHCGKIYPWNESETFAQQILQLLESEEQLKKMGENGFQAVNEKYLWEKDANRLLKIYAQNG